MKLPGTEVELDDRLQPLLVEVEGLRPDPMNPRTVVNLEKLVRRIERYGYTDPIIVNRETNVVEAGHMRLAACRELGATHVPVVYVDHDPIQGRAFNIAHNRSSEDVATWEREALADLLTALRDEDEFFDVIGFSDDDLAELLEGDSSAANTEPEDDDDPIPEPTPEDDEIPEAPPAITEPGETIEIGPHRLYCGDCLDLLRTLPDACIDAVVTDPPYGLSKAPDPAEVLRHWLAGEVYEHGAKGFMGKAWDSFVPSPMLWAEVRRVMKPGAQLVASFATRTYHFGVMAVCLAGFEVEDQIDWLFGQGFPKSFDIAKAIDKAAGHWRGRAGAPVPSHKISFGQQYEVTPKGQPITDDAKRWDGWGTALKPAHEPIVLARVPFPGTVAGNVLRHGVGGINVEGCRLGESVATWPKTRSYAPGQMQPGHHGETQMTGDAPDGRWPSNVLIDDEAAAMIDAQQAGASRYFPRFCYAAKASPTERDEGLDDMPSHDARVTVGRKPGSAGTQNPRAGAGRLGDRKNIHPTVKPVKLMRWLLKLVTPPGGLVLEPFAGSGTTYVAAVPMGFRIVGAELEPLHCDIIRARVQAAIDRAGAANRR